MLIDCYCDQWKYEKKNETKFLRLITSNFRHHSAFCIENRNLQILPIFIPPSTGSVDPGRTRSQTPIIYASLKFYLRKKKKMHFPFSTNDGQS